MAFNILIPSHIAFAKTSGCSFKSFSSFSFDKKAVSIKIAGAFVRFKTCIQLSEQKTGKNKIFPLKPELQKALNDFCKNRNPKEWLFLGRFNCQLDRIIVYKTIVQACNDLKIDANVGTHTMRKTFGYHHYKQFKDIALLQTIFNHYSPVVTKRYIGITQDEIVLKTGVTPSFALNAVNTEKLLMPI